MDSTLDGSVDIPPLPIINPKYWTFLTQNLLLLMLRVRFAFLNCSDSLSRIEICSSNVSETTQTSSRYPNTEC